MFISQLIRYDGACSSYECFILRVARLSCKLFGQGCVRERFKSSLRKFYCRYGDLITHGVSLSQILHDILGHDHIQWHPPLISEWDWLIKTKRRRSDPVLWQKPLHLQTCQKGKVTTQTTPQKSSINVTFNDMWRHIDVQADWISSSTCTYGRAPNARHLVGFFNVPVEPPTLGQPFYTVVSRNRPIWSPLRHAGDTEDTLSTWPRVLTGVHWSWHFTESWSSYLTGPYYRFWRYYLIPGGFYRTFATGAASQQRTLTPPDTWSFPNWDLHLF